MGDIEQYSLTNGSEQNGSTFNYSHMRQMYRHKLLLTKGNSLTKTQKQIQSNLRVNSD